MLLLDLSHTSHSPARTGVQRVALALRQALSARSDTALQEITHDPHAHCWRPLQAWERQSLDRPPAVTGKRGASWPWPAQVRGWWQHRRARRDHSLRPGIRDLPTNACGIVFPEIFTARTGRHLPALFAGVEAPRVAIFHDAIPLRLPELTPPGTVGRFPVYLDELRQFDGVAAVSEDSRQSLLDYWRWAGWTGTPPVITLPLGVDHLPCRTTQPPPTDQPPVVLSLGSLEGRKNHLTLLNACEKLWGAGHVFTLELVGTLQRETGSLAHARLLALQAAGRSLHYHGWLPDPAIQAAFARCAFTVYPSILEGFGLPVWESLLHGVPCVCSSCGAVAETARDGGCLTTNTADVDLLATAIASLLTQPERLTALRETARARQPRRWADYAAELFNWLPELRDRHNGAAAV